jgi:hypothetical protein
MKKHVAWQSFESIDELFQAVEGALSDAGECANLISPLMCRDIVPLHNNK